ncbi:MAG: Hsp70 family protein [Thermoanaerobaculia bacterium]
MELTSGVIIVLAVVAVVAFVVIRWGSRHEAAPPVEPPRTAVRSNSLPLVDWLLDRAFEQTGIRVADDALARQRITDAAATAMEDLRTGGSATISLPFLAADADGPRHFNVEFKRNPDSTFELQR